MSRRSGRIAAAATAIVASPTKIKPISASKVAKTPKASKKETSVVVSADEVDSAPKKKRRVAKETTEPEHVDDGKGRCIWATSSRYPLLQKYHDTEWCISKGFNRTNRYLFEMIILEGAQAGLSWSTVLHKRDAYREAYDNFDYNLIADTYTSPASNERLLQTNIVKNKLKVEASMINARAFRDLLNELYPDQAQPEDENGFWQFLQTYKKQPNRNKKVEEKEEEEVYLTRNEASDRLSADLKKRGFKFVGTTIMYSYLQAVGIELEGVHHTKGCFMHHKNKTAV
ncbi:Methyladenine glycosylase-domain-containing protein [Gamsiella multidivaricata]|uniref:Methyladenine glycosylase-domain-containing protein n=1 Tax=Gamsiella multidivaricata TaxID=101098 RepID=UPI00221FA90D|nr:Methyladenine glycosylase-domain-containing protein [Gamsiella multidivaricata]KAG0366710.1 hypothetical protein BGZ54_005005 [Gamsiella multidivaricata]KAI7830613.1 Methyladenine glycosylase-domain-containing protein [Gamsiella multidivaricata]